MDELLAELFGGSSSSSSSSSDGDDGEEVFPRPWRAGHGLGSCSSFKRQRREPPHEAPHEATAGPAGASRAAAAKAEAGDGAAEEAAAAAIRRILAALQDGRDGAHARARAASRATAVPPRRAPSPAASPRTASEAGALHAAEGPGGRASSPPPLPPHAHAPTGEDRAGAVRAVAGAAAVVLRPLPGLVVAKALLTPAQQATLAEEVLACGCFGDPRALADSLLPPLPPPPTTMADIPAPAVGAAGAADAAGAAGAVCGTPLLPAPSGAAGAPPQAGDGGLRPANQAMVFGQLPSWVARLAAVLPLGVLLPPDLACRCPPFDQLITNLYRPGEGLCDHVDLARFQDGVLMVSLGGPLIMHFKRPRNDPKAAVAAGYGPSPAAGAAAAGGAAPMAAFAAVFGDDDGGGDGMPLGASPGGMTASCAPGGGPGQVLLEGGDVVGMSGEARYGWTHGIAAVERERLGGAGGAGGCCAGGVGGAGAGAGEAVVVRGLRLSITLRRLCGGIVLLTEAEEA